MRENRKRPSHFGFNYCHQCKRAESIDDLIRCKKLSCQTLFCYSCIKKSKQVISQIKVIPLIRKKTQSILPILFSQKQNFKKQKNFINLYAYAAKDSALARIVIKTHLLMTCSNLIRVYQKNFLVYFKYRYWLISYKRWKQ